MPETVAIRCVNDGQPFELDADLVTAGDYRVFLKARLAAVKEYGVDEEHELVSVDAVGAVMARIAGRLDAKWKNATHEDLLDAMDPHEWKAFMELTGDAMKARFEKGGQGAPLVRQTA